MRLVLILFLRIILAMGLAFVPVANAFSMAQMAQSREDHPPCHPHTHQHKSPESKCCHGAAGQCHCAMASCLPAAGDIVTRASLPSDHPQTARRLALGVSSIPETPPPRTLI
jgi:hypothetical protein